jgi:hypothetical protein
MRTSSQSLPRHGGASPMYCYSRSYWVDVLHTSLPRCVQIITLVNKRGNGELNPTHLHTSNMQFAFQKGSSFFLAFGTEPLHSKSNSSNIKNDWFFSTCNLSCNSLSPFYNHFFSIQSLSYKSGPIYSSINDINSWTQSLHR